MYLNKETLKNTSFWKEHNYILPEYDIVKVQKNTKENPVWVHFGGGNLFRAYHALLAQKLLNSGDLQSGITMIGGRNYETIEKIYDDANNLSIAVTLKADGSVDKEVVGSVGEACIPDFEDLDKTERLKEVFCAPTLQLVTFTITEKGYALKDTKGNLLPAISADLTNGPLSPVSTMGKLVSLLYSRYMANKLPIALVSTDNCSHNGDKLKDAVTFIASEWLKQNMVEEGFMEYLTSDKVSYPWTMIDKITPRPDPSVEEMLKKDGLEDLIPEFSTPDTFMARFVNAEETGYLVIEDNFPNGRPALEKAGVLFTTRETVDKVETMKVGTCLNPLHTCLAIFGCLLGYTKISQEMKDEDLVNLIQKLGYTEGLPVVVDPKVLNPKEFIETCIHVRFPNPFMPDSPQRIATDTSQKISVRYGTTLSKYLENGMDVTKLEAIPMIYAGWVRYLMALDDHGNAFTLSSDPLLDEVCPVVKDIRFGDKVTKEQLLPILTSKLIFRYDLEEIGLADKVTQYFNMMIEGPGAIRKAIQSITK